ncbi:MAG: quinolinate synthase, partial [Methanothrix sp.]
MITEILALKEERHATILAHNYQIPEVQDVADLVGDSLELSRAAASLDSEVIIFCGVDFMAETAAILSPQKKVVLPVKGAWCPMAHMITPDQLHDLKTMNPKAAVVCYVNSTAEIKAESDICCTSANGVQVVNSLSEEQVIFVPDRNLAAYVARYTDKKIIPWNGYCYVHEHLTAEEVRAARAEHPNAEV